MEKPPVIEYAAAGEPTAMPGVVAWWVLAVLTVLLSLGTWFHAMDTRTFAEKWKQYGNPPALQPQFDEAARGSMVRATAVWSVAGVGWAVYLLVRWRGARRME